jgi:hypothetical protein
MSEHLTDAEAAELERLEKAATPGPWTFYKPSEFPRDWRVSRDGPAGELGHGSRDYIGRFTASHDRHWSGNGGRALEGPLLCDIEAMVAARNAPPKLLAERAALLREREEMEKRIKELEARVEFLS